MPNVALTVMVPFAAPGQLAGVLEAVAVNVVIVLIVTVLDELHKLEPDTAVIVYVPGGKLNTGDACNVPPLLEY